MAYPRHPEVVKVILEKRYKSTKSFKLPGNCPSCGEEVTRLENESAFRCRNYFCPAQVKGRINHFVSKRCMDIDGFGAKLVDQLVDAKMINNVADIFHLKLKQLSELERMAEKSSQKIMDAIDSSKSTTMARFIHALSIRNVGEHASKVLEKSFSGNLDKLMLAKIEDLTPIHEIGGIMAESIVNFFSDLSNQRVVQVCMDSGIHFAEVKQIQESEFSGKTFVFTGSLEKFSREDARSMVEKLGARASGSVSSKTDFLIIGIGAGSKLKKAEELNISIMTEDEFLNMIDK